jgi:hypothetical protein
VVIHVVNVLLSSEPATFSSTQKEMQTPTPTGHRFGSYLRRYKQIKHPNTLNAVWFYMLCSSMEIIFVVIFKYHLPEGVGVVWLRSRVAAFVVCVRACVCMSRQDNFDLKRRSINQEVSSQSGPTPYLVPQKHNVHGVDDKKSPRRKCAYRFSNHRL